MFILNKGTHALTFGGEMSLNKERPGHDLNNYGVFTFSSSTSARSGNALSDFYLGLTGTQNSGSAGYCHRQLFFYSLFAQEQLGVIIPNLNHYLGVRWDVQTAPTDPQEQRVNLCAGPTIHG